MEIMMMLKKRYQRGRIGRGWNKVHPTISPPPPHLHNPVCSHSYLGGHTDTPLSHH